jgi:hypothetical protein
LRDIIIGIEIRKRVFAGERELRKEEGNGGQ